MNTDNWRNEKKICLCFNLKQFRSQLELINGASTPFPRRSVCVFNPFSKQSLVLLLFLQSIRKHKTITTVNRHLHRPSRTSAWVWDARLFSAVLSRIYKTLRWDGCEQPIRQCWRFRVASLHTTLATGTLNDQCEKLSKMNFSISLR